jgi:transcriptional regulator GlxA family with amidase domain
MVRAAIAGLMLALSPLAQQPAVHNVAPKDLRVTSMPASKSINVAFVLSDGATVIDFAGPWEVFQDVMLAPGLKPVRALPASTADIVIPFRLYTVAETLEPVKASGGMLIVPNHTFDDAPKPDVIVVAAQRSRTDAFRRWLTSQAKTTDVLMSVCTGSFILAEFGMLDGQNATTHAWHDKRFTDRYPRVLFQSGGRYVENETVSTAGGLSSGVDLALRVVERYFGPEIAQATADYMMYRGDWKNQAGARGGDRNE